MSQRRERFPFAASSDGLFTQILLLQRKGYDFDIRRELVFHPKRKWRFDVCLTGPAIKIACEYNGGLFMPRGGHQNFKGSMRDWAKGNEAQLLGWLYLQFGPLETQSGEAMNVVERAIQLRR